MRYKLFSILANEKVAILDQETREKGRQLPLEKQKFDNANGEVYLIVLEDGCELRVGEKDGVYVNSEISILPSYKAINLPSNSSVSVLDLSSLKNNSINTSTGLSCGTFSQTTENIFSLENLSKSLKSSSLVTNTLCSDLENSANFPLDKPFGFETASTFCCLRNFSNLLSTFSSSRNLIFERDAELDIISTPHEISCILQGRFNMLISQRGKSFKDFFDRDTTFKHFQYLPDHNSCTFESWFSMTNFNICNNILIDFNSHKKSNGQEVYKDFEPASIKNTFSMLNNGTGWCIGAC